MNIAPYHNKFALDFKNLNIAGLETCFYMEPYDLEVLSYPEKFILTKGDYIFVSVSYQKVIGTFALMPIKKVF